MRSACIHILYILIVSFAKYFFLFFYIKMLLCESRSQSSHKIHSKILNASYSDILTRTSDKLKEKTPQALIKVFLFCFGFFLSPKRVSGTATMWKRTHQVCGSPPEGRNTIHQKTDFHPGWEHSHQDRNDESDGSKQICTHLQWWFTSGGQVEPKSIKKQNIFACEFYFCATVLSLWSEEYRLTEFQSLLCCYMTYMLSMCQTQCNKQTKRGKNKNGKRNKISLHFILLKWPSVASVVLWHKRVSYTDCRWEKSI